MRLWIRFGKLKLAFTMACVSLGLLWGQPEIGHAAKLAGTVGYLENDRNPATGVMTHWGYAAGAALDYNLRSIGIDLGSTQTFNQVRLLDTDNSSRVHKMDLSLYVSSDNVTYTRIDDFDFTRVGDTVYLTNFSATGRYVKVHNYFESTAQNFNFISKGSNLQNMMEVYNEPARGWTARGNAGWLYRKAIAVANANGSALLDRSVYVTKSALGTAALIAQGKMQADYRDVRFADSSNKELHYYMDANGFYVRIPAIAASANATIYMYYGNAAAQPVSDGLNTFQVEYGNKTFTDLTASGTFADNAKPVKLSNGNLMMVANDGNSGIYARFSADNGQTWSAPTMIVNRMNAGSDEPGSLFVNPATGEILLIFYTVYYYNPAGAGGCLLDTNCKSELMIAKSTDNGATWSTPTPIVTGSNYNVTYSNPIRLANGDIIFCFANVYQPDGSFHISVMYSSDNGVTWARSANSVEVAGTGGEGGASESTVVQLADGTINMYFRQQNAAKYRLGLSKSTDNGRTWSASVDSILYSSNTSPASMKNGSDVLLLWAGNNSYGGTSYYRNPLTLAYSQDQTATWRGYQDVLGRTSKATPLTSGWVTQPDMVRAPDGSYTFAWWGGGWTNAYAVRVEDFNRWLYQSHGAYDDFEYGDVVNNYWTVLGGSVATSTAQHASGASSLRIYDNNTTSLTEALRHFPATTKGTAKFKLRMASLADDFSFSLREPFSHTHAAEGTMFQFYVSSDGSLRYYDASGTRQELPVVTDLALNTWYDIELRFDATANTCQIFVDGASKGTVGYYKDVNVINYFHVATSSTAATGSDVYIDDFIVQDTEQALPTAGAVGAEEAL